MNRLSIRMILFIVALSALHISGISPMNPVKTDSRLGLGITAGIPGNRAAPWRPPPGNLAE
jgi:hypothetical protein